MKHPKTYAAYLCAALMAFLAGGCELSNETTTAHDSGASQEPLHLVGDLLEIETEQFYNPDYMRSYESQLLARYGADMVAAANQWYSNRQSVEGGSEDMNHPTLLLESIHHKSMNESSSIPTRIRVRDREQQSEDFVLAMTLYNGFTSGESDQSQELRSRDKQRELPYYSFLSPDRFSLGAQNNEGEEWPLSIEAQSLEDSEDRITLIFNEDGLQLEQLDEYAFTVASNDKLIMLDAISVIPNECESYTDLADYHECIIGSDSEESTSSEEGEWASKQGGNLNLGRGMDPGRYQPNSLYLVLKSLRLPYTGDGDGFSELQMYMDVADDQKYPLQHRYRFDRVFSFNPITGWSYNTMIEGADKYFPFYRYYQVPDINRKGRRYTFKNIIRYQTLGNPNSSRYYPSYVDYFPLINFSQVFGDWELVLMDDDKMYTHTSLRRVSTRVFTILLSSFNLELEIVETLVRVFTNLSHRFGSSDDVLVHTGVHQINSRTTQNIVGKEFVTRVITQDGRAAEYGFSGIID